MCLGQAAGTVRRPSVGRQRPPYRLETVALPSGTTGLTFHLGLGIEGSIRGEAIRQNRRQSAGWGNPSMVKTKPEESRTSPIRRADRAVTCPGISARVAQ